MDSGKIGDSEFEPVKPHEHLPIGKDEKEPEDVRGLLHEKIRTLADLKHVLIKHLGEKKGKEFYNHFMKNFVLMMLQEIQRSADQAKQAEDQARAMGP